VTGGCRRRCRDFRLSSWAGCYGNAMRAGVGTHACGAGPGGWDNSRERRAARSRGDRCGVGLGFAGDLRERASQRLLKICGGMAVLPLKKCEPNERMCGGMSGGRDVPAGPAPTAGRPNRHGASSLAQSRLAPVRWNFYCPSWGAQHRVHRSRPSIAVASAAARRARPASIFIEAGKMESASANTHVRPQLERGPRAPQRIVDAADGC